MATNAGSRRRDDTAKELQALNVVACALSGSIDPEQVLRRAVSSVLDVTGLDCGAVCLHDAETDRLIIHRTIGLFRELGEISVQRADSGTLPSRAFRVREPLVFDARDKERGYASITEGERRFIAREGVEAAIACRIESSAKDYGVVIVGTHDRRRPIDARELQFTRIVAGQIGVAVERARLFEDVGRRATEATTMFEIGRILGSQLDVGTVLPEALGLATSRFGLVGCVVELLQPLGGLRRFGGAGHNGIGVDESVIAVPLRTAGATLGRLLAIGSRHEDGETRRVLATIAVLVAVAVWNSRLYQDSVRLGVIEERNRLAREIHDGLTQKFYAIQLQLHAADRSGVDLPPLAAEHVHAAADFARAGLEDARRSVRGLRDCQLDGQGLVDALAELVARFERQTGIECVLVRRGDDDTVVYEAKAALYLSVQELLHNVEKHAAASSARVVVGLASDAVTVTVADDGHGFGVPERTAAGPSGTGYGLIGIRERMAAIGGTVQIRSQPGRGTVARLVAPRDE